MASCLCILEATAAFRPRSVPPSYGSAGRRSVGERSDDRPPSFHSRVEEPSNSLGLQGLQSRFGDNIQQSQGAIRDLDTETILQKVGKSAIGELEYKQRLTLRIIGGATFWILLPA